MNRHHNKNLGFSIIGPINLIVMFLLSVGTAYWYGNSIWKSIVIGVISAPLMIYIFFLFRDVIFNNSIALRYQSGPWNHDCSSCNERFQEYTSQSTNGDRIIVKCLKCGSAQEFDKKYNQIN